MSTLGTFAHYAQEADFNKVEALREQYEPGYANKKKAKPTVQYAPGETNIKRQPIYALGQTDIPRPIYKLGETDVKLPPMYAPGETDIKRQPIYAPGETDVKRVKPKRSYEKLSPKAKARYDAIKAIKTVRGRNLAVGIGLGTAGLAGLGAAAYLNRDSRNRRAEMGFGSAFANFAVSAEERAAARAYLESRGFTLKDETPELAAATRKRREEAVKRFTQTGNPEADAVINKMRGEARKARVKNIADTKAQKLVESNIDAGGDIYKGAKGMEYVTRTGALLGSPERGLIEAGKASKNEFVQNLAKGAEKVGRLGYKPGAGVMNKVVGRTFTGKVARLTGVGLGLSAIGGAMKRNRQEQG